MGLRTEDRHRLVQESMSRKRYFRVVRVELECGCAADLNTGRYRVGRDVAAMTAMTAARRGVWCLKCNAQCQPMKTLGVFRA